MSLAAALTALLLIPAFVWGVNRKVLSNRLNNISVAAISAVLLYIFILASVAYIEQQLDAKLEALDTNGDGVFAGNEVTPEQKEVMYEMTADTGRTFAPYTGAMFSFMYFFGVWAVLAAISRVNRRYESSNT